MITKIELNGLEVTCVASFKPETLTDYDYDVQTMDGVIHRKVKGVKTNYNIVFFNQLDDNFYNILRLCKKGEKVTLTLPIDGHNLETAEFLPEITDYNAKGELNDGTFYYNGLAVNFERVAYELL